MQNSEADREVIATLKSGSEEAFADFFFSHQEIRGSVDLLSI